MEPLESRERRCNNSPAIRQVKENQETPGQLPGFQPFALFLEPNKRNPNPKGEPKMKKKFIVRLDETIQRSCVVEAASRDEAEAKGYDILMNGGECDSESLGSENLTVTEKES